MLINRGTGRADNAVWIPSPNFDAREQHAEPEAVIVHSISLPPGEYGNGAVEQFFCNELDCNAHPYFKQIVDLRVSSHFFISRQGALIQFVSTEKRAWHAGESICLGKPKVNDFSIGIELEGFDEGDDGFTDAQYKQLKQLLDALQVAYTKLDRKRVFAHSDIAPGRKSDPGPFFNWAQIF